MYSSKQDIKRTLRENIYELYKIDWMQRISAESQKDVVRQYMVDVIEYGDDSGTLEDFIFERGYNEGSIYVCFDEFLGAEYQDKEYIKELIGEDNPEIYDLYLEDVEVVKKGGQA